MYGIVYHNNSGPEDGGFRRFIAYSLLVHLMLLGLIYWHREAPQGSRTMVVELQELTPPSDAVPDSGGSQAQQPPLPSAAPPGAQQGIQPALRRGMQPALQQAFDRTLQLPSQPPQRAPAGGARNRWAGPAPMAGGPGRGAGFKFGAPPFPAQQRRSDAAKAVLGSYSASRRP